MKIKKHSKKQYLICSLKFEKWQRKRRKIAKGRDEEKFLIKIPFLGYFFRKIKENKKAIEKELNTGKKSKTKIKDYLCGVIRIICDKTFVTLRLKR